MNSTAIVRTLLAVVVALIASPLGGCTTGLTQGGLNIVSSSASPFLVEVDSLQANDTTGAVSNWDPNLNYTWRLATSTFNLNGFAADAISLDTSDFSSFNATPGTFSVSADGNNLFLHYVGVPEPTSLVLLLGGLCVLRKKCIFRMFPWR